MDIQGVLLTPEFSFNLRLEFEEDEYVCSCKGFYDVCLRAIHVTNVSTGQQWYNTGNGFHFESRYGMASLEPIHSVDLDDYGMPLRIETQSWYILVCICVVNGIS
ncbi:hypothetical protein AC1031_003016 [Aphanomyces cochlioides]|nr:hypothetical protein AC1031_003016 [Aphanomyces cochlioides]